MMYSGFRRTLLVITPQDDSIVYSCKTAYKSPMPVCDTPIQSSLIVGVENLENRHGACYR